MKKEEERHGKPPFKSMNKYLPLRVQDKDIENTPVNDYCESDLPQYEKFILVFAKNTIGEGEEKLGKMLVDGFLNAFMQMEKIPQKIIFMNSGIDLVLKNSQIIPILKEYEKKEGENLPK